MLFEGIRSVKVRNAARTVERLADVVVPDYFTVSRVKERDTIAVKVEWTIRDTPGIPFCLGEHILRAEGELLGLDDSQNLTIDTQGVISRAIVCRILFYRAAVVRGKRSTVLERH